MSDEPNAVGSSRYHLIRACDESLRRLGTEYIDIYTMHGFDAQTSIEETLRALETLVQSGKVRYIACSNFSGWQLMKALASLDKYGWARYMAHQAHYSLLRREYEWDLMPLALDQTVSTLVWGPLSQGRLSGKYRRGSPSRQAVASHRAPAKGRPPQTIGSTACGRARRHQRGNGQDRGASRAQLAPTTAKCRQRDYWGARRGAIARESGGCRLDSNSGAGRSVGGRQCNGDDLSLLAPTWVYGA